MAKKRILLIVPFSPLPVTSGGRQRIWQTIHAYSQDHDLTVWSFVESVEEQKLQQAWFKKINVKYKLFQMVASRKPFSFFLHGQPFWFSRWWSKEVINELSKVKKDDFNLIQVEGTQLLYLGRSLPQSIKVIFVAYDISTVSFWRRWKQERNLLKKVLHLWRLIEVLILEASSFTYFAKIITMSSTDERILNKYFHLKNTVVVPNGIEKTQFLPARNKQRVSLGFIGGLDHPPNRDAVRFIVEKILPELDSRQIPFDFYFAGSTHSKQDKDLLSSVRFKTGRIYNLGVVPSVAEFYQKIDMLVAPIFSGSGTRIKILESLSFGRPVLTTEIGAEGLEIDSGYLSIIDSNSTESDWADEMLSISHGKVSDLKELKEVLNKFYWSDILKLSVSSLLLTGKSDHT